jgi:threonylcarbamoyladenosine tRNA methylthiotransferase MtaB
MQRVAEWHRTRPQAPLTMEPADISGPLAGMRKKTFNIINFGCRATQADGAALEQAFLDHGLERRDGWEQSDVVLINTCTVTNAADVEARQMIRRVHRENPDARIVVTGCYAQRAPRELVRIEGVTCVVGNSHKDQLVPMVVKDYLDGPVPPVLSPANLAAAENHIFCSSIFESRELRTIADPSGGGRTRPVLKVQDGCSYRCSYCIIPWVRGDSRSLPPGEVLRQVQLLLDRGFREITLTGIHLGGYGKNLASQGGLAQLVRVVLKEERLARLRLSSIEPLEYTDELIDLVAGSPKMAKHFHVPLQSGSDRILRLMRRPYTSSFYARLVDKMRRRAPHAAIGADVMVGFPTETEGDHLSTKALLDAAPMTYLHVFPFSPRPGTASASLKPEVRAEVAQERSRELRELAYRKNQAFRNLFVGETLSVITLGNTLRAGAIEALSTNYLKMEVVGYSLRPNEVLDAKVTGMTLNGLSGVCA